jgi:prepilin-type N-terminal cleavage/methylation domain-containing protein
MRLITNVILNSFQDPILEKTRCRNKFGMTTEKGFTLIELMVVLSITAVLGTLGIAGFTTYNQIQVLQAATSDVVSVLNLAKSRSQSQIKPSALCSSSGSLDGYKVEILTPKNYTLFLRCKELGSSVDRRVNEETKALPTDLNFASSVSFFFPVQIGGVQTAGQIVISGYGRSKTITVNSLGGVSVQ